MVRRLRWVYGIMLIILTIGLFAEDGTITMRVTGAGDHDGKRFYCAVFAEGNQLGRDDRPISNGYVSTLVSDVVPTPQGYSHPVVFTGGESYDASGLIDVDLNDLRSSGDYETDPLKSVIVEGDTVVDLVYPTDFIVVP